jgi:hypothetical protein
VSRTTARPTRTRTDRQRGCLAAAWKVGSRDNSRRRRNQPIGKLDAGQLCARRFSSIGTKRWSKCNERSDPSTVARSGGPVGSVVENKCGMSGTGSSTDPRHPCSSVAAIPSYIRFDSFNWWFLPCRRSSLSHLSRSLRLATGRFDMYKSVHYLHHALHHVLSPPD